MPIAQSHFGRTSQAQICETPSRRVPTTGLAVCSSAESLSKASLVDADHMTFRSVLCSHRCDTTFDEDLGKDRILVGYDLSISNVILVVGIPGSRGEVAE